MSQIKNHFEEEASYYDELILKIIPYYPEMVQALVLAIHFSKNTALEVCDLGCGTGTISKHIVEKFKKATITCVDMAPNMLSIAKTKLKGIPKTEFINANFYEFEFPKKYDVVISSLALHHLVTNEDKINFYKKIYTALKPKGIFLNADVVLASDPKLQKQFMKKWIEFISRKNKKEEVKKCLTLYKKEDRPAKLIDQLNWLKKIGFKNVDVIWKYYNFGVYLGRK